MFPVIRREALPSVSHACSTQGRVCTVKPISADWIGLVWESCSFTCKWICAPLVFLLVFPSSLSVSFSLNSSVRGLPFICPPKLVRNFKHFLGWACCWVKYTSISVHLRYTFLADVIYVINQNWFEYLWGWVCCWVKLVGLWFDSFVVLFERSEILHLSHYLPSEESEFRHLG